MLAHVASMSVAAPLAALAIHRNSTQIPPAPAGRIWTAAALQMALLWLAHSPAVHHSAQSSPLAHLLIHTALFISALAFWMSILVPASSWQAIGALLVSGKLACLLGALLIFSPRLLLHAAASPQGLHAMAPGQSNLADQHLAGLIMIAACPLSYVLTAIVLAARTVSTLEHVNAPRFSRNQIGP